MSYEHTPDGGVAESMDEHHGQPMFIGRLAIGLGAFAVLFAVVVLIAAATMGG